MPSHGLNFERLDHIVLTCADIAASRSFFGDALGMRVIDLPDKRVEVHFGLCKINLQQAGRQYGPPANKGRVWNGNLCIVCETPISQVTEALAKAGIAIEEGPVERIGALGPIESVYFRDPDGNLLEICNYLKE